MQAINYSERQIFEAKVEAPIYIKRHASRTDTCEGFLKPTEERALSNMLVKLILISAIFSFVFVRSSESRGIEFLSLVGEPYSDTDMDAEAANTGNQIVQEAPPPLTSANLLPRSIETGSVHDHAVYHGMKHPKKRATNYKDDRQADPLPGCCG